MPTEALTEQERIAELEEECNALIVQLDAAECGALDDRIAALEAEVLHLVAERDALANALELVRAAAHERDWGRGRGSVIW